MASPAAPTPLAFKTMREMAFVLMGRPPHDDEEAITMTRRCANASRRLQAVPDHVRQEILAIVSLDAEDDAIASSRPAPPAMTGSLFRPLPEIKKEEEEDVKDDDLLRSKVPERHNGTMSSTLGPRPAPGLGERADRPAQEGYNSLGRPTQMAKETRAQFNERRIAFARANPDNKWAQNDEMLARKDQQRQLQHKAQSKDKKLAKREEMKEKKREIREARAAGSQ